MPKPASISFSFKVPDEKLKEVLLQYLLMEGCISPEMGEYFTGIERKGRASMVEFTIPADFAENKPYQDINGVRVTYKGVPKAVATSVSGGNSGGAKEI